MRKLTAILFVVLLSTSAFAAPNDSSDRGNHAGAIARLVQTIKRVIHVFDLGQPEPPQPTTTTTVQ